MTYTPMSMYHKNLILKQGCSQKCNNNENIYVNNNKSVHHKRDLVKMFFSSILSIDWFTVLSNMILVTFINQF